MRGRLQVSPVIAALEGLIPAGAGQTRYGSWPPAFRWAHPHRCGADALMAVIIDTNDGSSPQVRGRLRASRRDFLRRGLIPAGTGQTRGAPGGGARPWAHPRRCGADNRLPRGLFAHYGSSPRVRGRRSLRLLDRRRERLIPAGAGQTRRYPACAVRPGAHPRGCGADGLQEYNIVGDLGSSPRVRGRPLIGAFSQLAPGLIPAGAGQTS